MAKLPDPMPKRTRGKTPSVPLEPPPAPPRYTADGTWRPRAAGWPDRPRIHARTTPKDQQS